MNRILLTGTLAMMAVAAYSVADAQGRPGDAGNSGAERQSMPQRDSASLRREKAEAERVEAERRKMEAARKRAEAEAQSQSAEARTEHRPNEHAADAAAASDANAGGSATAAEMRERRDEGKAIKEAYRADREPGQEGVDRDAAGPDGGATQKEETKKPWWKFWGE